MGILREVMAHKLIFIETQARGHPRGWGWAPSVLHVRLALLQPHLHRSAQPPSTPFRPLNTPPPPWPPGPPRT
jgi:hypothetical protein